MNVERLKRLLARIPLHVVIISLLVIWLIPTFGVFVTSFRSREAVRTSGWWRVFSRPPAPSQVEYDVACAPCHGANGALVPEADLSDPEVVGQYTRTDRLLGMLRQEVNGQPHVQDPEWQALIQDPSRSREALDRLAPVSQHLGALSGGGPAVDYTLTTSNWVDALVGYKGTTTYQQDCATGASESGQFSCTLSDLLNPEGMARAFLNSLSVTIPATILPILLAAFAAYAFAWLDFRGRTWMFAALVGLQIVPLQMTLVPIARLYSRLGLESSFLGIWLLPSTCCAISWEGCPATCSSRPTWTAPTTGRPFGRSPCPWRCRPSLPWASFSSCGYGTTCWWR
jgi:alpha-glucoside transport system permease protein